MQNPREKERKAFFSEEKKQKTFMSLQVARVRPRWRRSKSLLVLFFRKEHTSLLTPQHRAHP
jgi:hypothetical protein